MIPSRDRLRRILALGVPILLGMMSQNVLNLVDTAFVGRLGPAALAAVGMGGFTNWLLVAFLVGIGSGVQAIAARRLGEGRLDRTATGLNAALVLAVVLGVPAAALGWTFAPEIFATLNRDPAVRELGAGYLAARFVAAPCVAANFSFRGFWNGTNRPRHYLGTLVFMHTINVVLDYGLIFGELGLPELGAVGAGWATSIALAAGTGLYFVLGLLHGRQGGFLDLRGVVAVLGSLLRLSVPAGLQQVLFSGGFVAFFAIAGRVGTEALAASTVLINLTLVCVLPGLGFGLAGASLVGQALGAGDLQDARRWGWETVTVGACLMGAIGVTMALGARLWLGLFIADSPATLELAVAPLILMGLIQGLDAVGVVLSNVLTGSGDTVAMLVVTLVAQWGLFLPAAAASTLWLGGGMLALWVCMAANRALVSAVVAARFSGDAWARHAV